jgi:hypothetical protein
MISFSIDKQRGQVNAEGMSRPVDTKTKIKKQSTARLGLDIHGAVTYFCFSTEKETFEWPNFKGSLQDSFGVGRANQSYLLYLPSYARNVTYTNVRRKGSGQLTTHETSLFNFDICGSDDNIVRTDK